MFFCFFLLAIPTVLASTNYTSGAFNLSWSDSSLRVANYTVLATAPATPYLIVQVLAQRSINIYFNYGGSGYNPVGGSQFDVMMVFNSLNMRVDSTQSYLTTINYTSTPFGNPKDNLVGGYSVFQLNYFGTRYLLPSRTTSNICVNIGVSAIGTTQVCTTTFLPNVTVAGIAYSLNTLPGFICFNPLNPVYSFTGVIDAAPYFQLLISYGLLSPQDYIGTLAMDTQADASLNITQQSTVARVGRNIQLSDTVITLGGMRYRNWQYSQDLFSTDYCNTSLQPGQSSLQGTLVDFFYARVQLNVSHILAQAFPSVSFGFVNSSWVTPAGRYGFPVSVSNPQAGLLVDLTYSIVDAAFPSNRAVCSVLILRNDYNATTLAFSNASYTYPHAELMVCTDWPLTLSPQGNCSNILFMNYPARVCTSISTSATNSSVSWPTYTFTVPSFSPNTLLIDMLTFARHVGLADSYAVGVQVGARIFNGKGSFQFNSLSVRQIVNECAVPFSYSESAGCPVGINRLDLLIEAIVSFPNSGLLMQITSFILAVDDLSYYAYHVTHYDRSFRIGAELCWNITNNKWIPTFLLTPFSQISSLLGYISISDTNQITPVHLRYGGDDLFFINNTQQYLLVTVPLSVCMFLLLKCLRKWLPVALDKLLKSFSCTAMLILSLLSDNLQYLSFRAFEQLRYITPTDGKLGYCNTVLTLFVLFIVIVGCLSLHPILCSLHRYLKFDQLRGTLPASILMTTFAMVKVGNGFAHGYLQQPLLQLLILLAGNLTIMAAIVKLFQHFQLKRYAWLNLFMYLSKSLLGVVLICECLFPLNWSLFTMEEQQFSNLTTTLLVLQFGLLFVGFLAMWYDSIREIIYEVKLTFRGRVRMPKKILKMRKHSDQRFCAEQPNTPICIRKNYQCVKKQQSIRDRLVLCMRQNRSDSRK